MASPLEMTEMYDNALLGILQHVGNIQDFLQVYFGFLYRKTDFYRLLSGANDKMGFPPGVAEKMVLKVKFVNTFTCFTVVETLLTICSVAVTVIAKNMFIKSFYRWVRCNTLISVSYGTVILLLHKV